MKNWIKISLFLNLIIFSGIFYLFVFGKQHVKKFFHKQVIGVRHQQLKSMFEALPTSKGAIVFLGNSITEGCNWNELFPDKIILNRGIGGDITAGVLTRINEVVRHEPSKLFICIGTNDLAMDIENSKIMENYKAIIDKVQKESPSTKIYVQSVLPTGKKLIFGHENHKIAPLNAEIEKICAELDVTYIDLYSEMLDEDGYLDKQYSNDNLHLLGSGYLLWKEKIKQYVYE
jgi:lysophospholipase L1-like esterase